MNRARNGYTVRTNVISLREGSSPIAYNDRKIIEISTTTITTIVPYDKGTYPENSTGQSGSILSSQSGFFDLSRNTVNPLYFTVRADASRDDLYVCIQPSNSSKCSISSNYAVVTSKYDPLSYDSVPSNDRWIFNVYYNSSLWGVAGGKIYFKNGIANVPNIYSVNIKQS